jgi:hypothetical protein
LLHAHAADPAAPVHAWWAPQGTAGPSAQQPSLLCVHVASPPETQVACPEEQLSIQILEHVAAGAIPEQSCGDGHVEVEATYAQPFASVMQVASVALSWHTVPACAQGLGLHAHEAPASPKVHVSFAPQVAVVTHWVQPPTSRQV